MPRLSKAGELEKWVANYYAYHFAVKFPLYELFATVLALTEAEALAEIMVQYPEGVKTLLFVANKVHTYATPKPRLERKGNGLIDRIAPTPEPESTSPWFQPSIPGL